MQSFYVKVSGIGRKALLVFFLGTLIANSGCYQKNKSQAWSGTELRIALDQVPSTLNPRATLDAAGQRLGALLYRALTRIDENLSPVGDLAESWEILEGGRVWKFKLRPGLIDQANQTIDGNRIAQCLEQYRIGKPTSPLSAAIPYWQKTNGSHDVVYIELERPDPYLARNLSSFRYFTTGAPTPCVEPRPGESLTGSGKYKLKNQNAILSGLNELDLVPILPEKKSIHVFFIRDETSRALKLLRGEIDLIQNGLSLTKTRWFQKKHSDQFAVLEREGVNVSYLAFNMNDPILSKKDVRKAISAAILREEIIQHKLLGFGSVAGSLLSPILPESHQVASHYDPKNAEALLDKAGLPRDPKGKRFSLHYKTTPVREGIETALLFQKMLKKVGIELILDVVEPAVFLASTRKGNFQLYSSRWIGVSDGSILYKTLRTGQPNNRAHYSNVDMDKLLDQAMVEPSADKRIGLLMQVQVKMVEDLPYFPLWYWTNALIMRKELKDRIRPHQLSLSGSLDPLTNL